MFDMLGVCNVYGPRGSLMYLVCNFVDHAGVRYAWRA